MKNDSKCNIESILRHINWDKSPLIPTITQDFHSKEVLMLAFSDRKSLALSLESGLAHYFSRSKNRIWQKGEESGNIQKIIEISIDCDNDAILFMVNQSGNACHTGNLSCFFKTINLNDLTIKSNLLQSHTSPYHIIDRLYHILQERKFAPCDKSYTASLYAKGENAICKKIIEEAGEVCFAIKDFLKTKEARKNTKQTCNNATQETKESVIYESADVIYHLLVGLSYCDISPDEVMSELERRFGISGIDEKNSRK